MADVKWSQFPSQTPGNSDEVVGLHSGNNARFSIANIVAAVRQGLTSIFVPKSDVGEADGVASLDSTGKVPSAQLPPIASTAADVTYDNTQSGLTADDVQEAIDELAQGGGGNTVVANPSGPATDTLNKLQVDSTIYQLLSGGTAITFPGFSTTERVVGTWDGYPLYAKIFHQTLQKITSAQRITVSSENIEIHLMLGTAQASGPQYRVPLPYNGYLWAYQDGYTQIVVTLPNTTYNTIDFLLVYTKPSDSPAPTPGGIPGDSVSYDPTTSSLTATNVQDAIDEVVDDMRTKVPVYGLGKNQLDNAYFVGGGSQLGDGIFPVNQRGQSSYSGTGYGIDRWGSTRSNTITLEADGLKFAFGSGQTYQQIVQNLNNVPGTIGRTFTLSAYIVETTQNIFLRYNFGSAGTDHFYELIPAGTTGLVSMTFTVPASASLASVQISSIQNGYTSGYFKVSAIKLELGTEQTLAHQENGTWVLNEIPDYGEELRKCQRYLWIITADDDIHTIAFGSAVTTTAAGFMIPLPETMRMNKVLNVSTQVISNTLPRVYSNPSNVNKNASAIASASIIGNQLNIGLTINTATLGESMRLLLMQGSKLGVSLEP